MRARPLAQMAILLRIEVASRAGLMPRPTQSPNDNLVNRSDADAEDRGADPDLVAGHVDVELGEEVAQHARLDDVEDVGDVQDVDIPDIQVVQVVVQDLELVVAQELVVVQDLEVLDLDVEHVEGEKVGGALDDADAGDVVAVKQGATVAGGLVGRSLIRGVAAGDTADRTESTDCTNEHHGTNHGYLQREIKRGNTG